MKMRPQDLNIQRFGSESAKCSRLAAPWRSIVFGYARLMSTCLVAALVLTILPSHCYARALTIENLRTMIPPSDRILIGSVLSTNSTGQTSENQQYIKMEAHVKVVEPFKNVTQGEEICFFYNSVIGRDIDCFHLLTPTTNGAYYLMFLKKQEGSGEELWALTEPDPVYSVIELDRRNPEVRFLAELAGLEKKELQDFAAAVLANRPRSSITCYYGIEFYEVIDGLIEGEKSLSKKGVKHLRDFCAFLMAQATEDRKRFVPAFSLGESATSRQPTNLAPNLR